MHVLLMGPPGSGRRTQARLLAEALGVTAIDGEGQRPASVQHAVTDALSRGGFVLSGCPSTLAEARELDDLLSRYDEILDAVIVLNVGQQLRVHRLERGQAKAAPSGPSPQDSERRTQFCEQQYAYATRTVAVLGHYRSRGLLDVVDGGGRPEHVTLRLAASIHAIQHERAIIHS